MGLRRPWSDMAAGGLKFLSVMWGTSRTRTCKGHPASASLAGRSSSLASWGGEGRVAAPAVCCSVYRRQGHVLLRVRPLAQIWSAFCWVVITAFGLSNKMPTTSGPSTPGLFWNLKSHGPCLSSCPNICGHFPNQAFLTAPNFPPPSHMGNHVHVTEKYCCSHCREPRLAEAALRAPIRDSPADRLFLSSGLPSCQQPTWLSKRCPRPQVCCSLPRPPNLVEGHPRLMLCLCSVTNFSVKHYFLRESASFSL